MGFTKFIPGADPADPKSVGHWVGVGVDMREKHMTFFDGMASAMTTVGRELLEAIFLILDEEWRRKMPSGSLFDRAAWSTSQLILTQPQTNGYDCALNLCSFFHHWSFNQHEDMRGIYDTGGKEAQQLCRLRKTIALSLAQKTESESAVGGEKLRSSGESASKKTKESGVVGV